MAPAPLTVWLHGEHVATLVSRRGELGLTYSDAARSHWPLNTPVVSVSMPLSLRPYRNRQAFPFFDGLLPEGEVRRMVAFDLGLREADSFGLLAALGRDCAGALVLQPATAAAPEPPSLDDALPVDDEEVARRIDQLRVAPLGVDNLVRVSLPGLQQKLLLTRLPSGGWALPAGGAPSTHLLKPPIPGLERSVENEAFCMRVARRTGLRVADVDVADVAGRTVLVVERFDRTRTGPGHVARVHQEDLCQALSVPTARKYEERGGPALRDVAAVLERWRAPRGDLTELLRACVFTVTLGDADRHAKNVSVLHGEDGRIRLAPLYDVMCTRWYPHVSPVPGMFVAGRRSVDEVQAADFVAEAVSWGLPEAAAWAAVRDVADALADAIAAEADASSWAPPGLVALLDERAGALRAGALRAGSRGAGSRGAGSRGAASRGAQVHALPAAPAVIGSPGHDSHPGRIWVEPYRRADGTEVRGHWRRAEVAS